MGSPDVICVGDVMVDVRVAPDAVEGGHVVGKLRLRGGGSAASAAVWAAAAGAGAAVVGRVGDDLAGRALGRELTDRGVDPRLAVDPHLPTGCVLMLGDRIVAERGATTGLSPRDLPSALEAPAVLVSGYVLLHRDSEEAGRAALERARGTWVAVDAGSARLLDSVGRDGFFAATKAATVVLLDEEEALALTGDEPEQAARALSDRYRLACVKCGAAGAVASVAGTLVRAAAPRIEAGDPTGAGDAFAGTLLAALASHRSVEAALHAACAAGAAAVASRDAWPRL